MSRVEISSLTHGPIKSCARVDVEKLEIGEKGPKFGRHWMVVGASGKFMLSDKYPKMVWIEPSISEVDNVLVLEGKGHDQQVDISINDNGPRRVIEMFSSGMRHEAIDDGEDAANWLRNFLGEDGCRLVHMPTDYSRTDSRGLASFGFADSWSMSLGNDASLRELNNKVKKNGGNAVPKDRFGHDVWATGADAFDEDGWGEIRVGGNRIAVVKPIVRCARTLVKREAKTLEELLKKDKEPLATLSQTRKRVRIKRGRKSSEVVFGQKLAHLWSGDNHEIHLGDKIEVLVYKAPPNLTKGR